MGVKLTEIHPKIYLLSLENSYDLALHFCRVQEFYDNPTWGNKFFSLLEFMGWYAQEKGNGIFTYPHDWSGFNIPGKVMNKLYQDGSIKKIPDFNQYDEVMVKILKELKEKNNGNDWYLIGALENETHTVNHEIAHGLWSTNKKYKTEMKKLIDNLTDEQYNCLREWLLNHMYCEEVVEDEMQAYLATGLADDMNATLRRERVQYRTIRKPFAKLFHEFYRG